MFTTSPTSERLAQMLVENTGRSMLDSGGESGRAWQRNAGMTVADFLARPAQVVDDYGITLDVFHYLNDRLVYDADLDKSWNDFALENPDLTWGDCLEEWLDLMGVPTEGDGEFYSNDRWGFNSYNFDGCLLGGTIQGVKFGIDSEVYLALQIHGGADVRGGYTKPVIFTGDIEALIFDLTNATLCCPKPDCDFFAQVLNGAIEYVNLTDSTATPEMLIEMDVPTELPSEWEISDGCPFHKVALV